MREPFAGDDYFERINVYDISCTRQVYGVNSKLLYRSFSEKAAKRWNIPFHLDEVSKRMTHSTILLWWRIQTLDELSSKIVRQNVHQLLMQEANIFLHNVKLIWALSLFNPKNKSKSFFSYLSLKYVILYNDTAHTNPHPRELTFFWLNYKIKTVSLS